MNSELKSSAFSIAAPEGLRVCMLAAPHACGLPREALSFSWIMRAGHNDDIQTAYRILIARRPEDMTEGDYLLDTGWTVSDESSDVRVAGLDALLADNELYYWAVQLRNRSGAESVLSLPMPFVTAAGDGWEDTRGLWSANEAGKGDFCLIRHEFELADRESIERAVISVTACSPEPTRSYVFKTYLNGRFVGLGPYRTGRDEEGEELLGYNTFDITDHLAEGINALGAICYTPAYRAFLCQITLFYRNGTRRVLVNSGRDAENFFAMDGGDVFGSGRSAGAGYAAAAEDLDATCYPYGFDRPGFSDVWPAAVPGEDLEIEKERKLIPCPGEPVECVAQEAALVERREDGRVFIDMGQEIIGGLRLSVASPEVHRIKLYFGEELDENGRVRYHLRTGNVYEEEWTLGAGETVLENFGMKAFRYVEIEGCRAEVHEDSVCGIAVRCGFDAALSSFVCSNEWLVRLYDTCKYAVCATDQGLYVDAQTRSRTPREGDALIHMLASYTYTDRMASSRLTVDYLLSHPSPPADYRLLAVHLCWLDYLYSGNRELVVRRYELLRRTMAALAERVDPEIGLLAAASETTMLIDHPTTLRDGYAVSEARYNTVYNSIYYLCLCDMADMAAARGKESEAVAYRAAADTLRTAILARLYDAEKGAFCDGLREDGTPIEHYAQHATAYALASGIYTDAKMKDTLGRKLIAQDTVKTGMYGAYFLFEGLYRAGFGAYATALLASDDKTYGAHTFAAALRGGDITIAPEAWSVQEAPFMSYAHALGAVPAALIVRGMFGIRPTRPGFRCFDVRPAIGDLPYAAIRVPTVKGVIGVSIGQNAEAYEAEVTVPPNTTATVYLPVLPGGTDALFVNSQIANFPQSGDHYRIELGSGTHRLLSQ